MNPLEITAGLSIAIISLSWLYIAGLKEEIKQLKKQLPNEH